MPPSLRLIISALSIISLPFFIFVPAKATSPEFDTSVSSTYTINPEGHVTVNQIYTLTNLTASIYPTRYQINLDSPQIRRVQATTAAGEAIPYTLNQDNNSTLITLNFPQKNVGKGKSLDFNLAYDSMSFAAKKGASLELTIPKINPDSNLTSSQAVLMIPIEYGGPVTLSPKPVSQTTDPAYTKITFTGNEFWQNGITAIFGDKQIYDVSLIYQLKNSTITPVETQVALPPDTENQRVYLESIEPKPQTINLDPDGNWIATYSLKPQESVEVKYLSHIIVYSKPTPYLTTPKDTLSKLVQEKNYWPVSHPQIKTLSAKINSPQAIYQYVVKNLTYNYQRADSADINRLGALKALVNPNDSLCLEFSDLTVTLLRAGGIPAKLITGFGVSDNLQKKPISSGPNVFHSWVAYYDPSSDTWLQIDPTWGNTTGGNDYFSSIGFNHLTFTLHGLDPVRPYPPGSYQDPNSASTKIEVTDKFPQKNVQVVSELSPSLLFNLGLSSTLNLSVTNQGSVALYNFPIDIAVSGRELIGNPNPKITSLLPFETATVPLQFKHSFTLEPLVLRTLIYGNSQTFTIKSPHTISAILAILICAASLAALFLYRFQKSRRLLVS